MRRTRLESLAIAVGALVTAGCVNVDYVPTNPPPHPMRPRPAAEVEVFQTGVPGRPYVEVAVLEVDAPTNDPEMLIAQLRQAAGDHGCEGIMFVGGTKRKGFHAVCVVYRDPRSNH